MGLYEHWPYTNFHELNLDWIIEKMQELVTEWAAEKESLDEIAETLENDFSDLKNYVTNYFDNTDFAALVSDKLDEMYQDGTLFGLFELYVPYVCPKMYGADEESANNQTTLSAMFSAAVESGRPVFFDGKTYNCNGPVTITGTVKIYGNGSKLIFTPNVNGIVFTAAAPNSIVKNLTITSTASQYTTAETTGLLIGGEHLTLDGVNISNFGTGLKIDDTLSDSNQTGTVIVNTHVRYCTNAFYLGASGNNKTTDFYIDNCTASASNVGFYIGSCIGYKISNVHVWGDYNGAGPVSGFQTRDTSLTSFSGLYIEPTTGPALNIHTRKGFNLTDVVFRTSDASNYCVKIEGSTSGWTANASNIIVRSDDTANITIFYLQNAGRLNINSYEDTELNGYVTIADGRTDDVFIDGLHLSTNAFKAITSEGATILTGAFQENVPAATLEKTISIDFTNYKKSTGYIINLQIMTRSNDNVIHGGFYQIPIYATYSAGIKIPAAGLETILANTAHISSIAAVVNADNINQLDITITKNSGIIMSYIIQPLGLLTA